MKISHAVVISFEGGPRSFVTLHNSKIEAEDYVRAYVAEGWEELKFPPPPPIETVTDPVAYYRLWSDIDDIIITEDVAMLCYGKTSDTQYPGLWVYGKERIQAPRWLVSISFEGRMWQATSWSLGKAYLYIQHIFRLHDWISRPRGKDERMSDYLIAMSVPYTVAFDCTPLGAAQQVEDYQYDENGDLIPESTLTKS